MLLAVQSYCLRRFALSKLKLPLLQGLAPLRFVSFLLLGINRLRQCFRLTLPYIFRGPRKAIGFLGIRKSKEVFFCFRLQAETEFNVLCSDVVGLSGLEPPTSRLSGVRSNRLSYRPMQVGFLSEFSSFPTSFYQYSFLNVHFIIH